MSTESQTVCDSCGRTAKSNVEDDRWYSLSASRRYSPDNGSFNESYDACSIRCAAKLFDRLEADVVRDAEKIEARLARKPTQDGRRMIGEALADAVGLTGGDGS